MRALSKRRYSFTQSKTKAPISLPLTSEIGWAVIDYLKYGRPKVDSPYIFVRHMAPFEPFAAGDHLTQLIKRYMEIAHLPTLRKKRGMHSLRHTMASMLLEKETPLVVISDILGHINTDSTGIYLKIDIQKLKECTLSFEENHHEKN
jgi:site-specific recombinase XerD